MSAMVDHRSFLNGRYACTIDGFRNTCYVQLVNGGTPSGGVVNEGIANGAPEMKHLGGVEIDPIELRAPIGVCRPFFEWAQKVRDGEDHECNGSLVLADGHYNECDEQEFFGAQIKKISLPALEKGKFGIPEVTMSWLPQRTTLRKGSGRDIGTLDSPPQAKLWSIGAFRFEIDGVSCKAPKVSAFSIEQAVTPFHYGRQRFAELIPAGMTCGNLTVHIPVKHFDQFYDWNKRVLEEGARCTDEERTGALTFYGPIHERLFTIDLMGIGLHRPQREDVQVGQSTVAAYKVDVHVQDYKFDFGVGFA